MVHGRRHLLHFTRNRPAARRHSCRRQGSAARTTAGPETADRRLRAPRTPLRDSGSLSGQLWRGWGGAWPRRLGRQRLAPPQARLQTLASRRTRTRISPAATVRVCAHACAHRILNGASLSWHLRAFRPASHAVAQMCAWTGSVPSSSSFSCGARPTLALPHGRAKHCITRFTTFL